MTTKSKTSLGSTGLLVLDPFDPTRLAEAEARIEAAFPDLRGHSEHPV